VIDVRLIQRPLFLDPGDLGARDDQLQGTDAEKLIEVAGRECYDSFGKGRNSLEYAAHILEVKHGSVLEHAFWGFRLRHASRGFANELVRHRVGVAISQRSTRYVDEHDSPWAVHPVLQAWLDDPAVSPQDKEKFQGSLEVVLTDCRQLYSMVVDFLEPWLKARAPAEKLGARKQARGAARGYLGNALETSMIWSANLRTLLHVFAQRGAIFADAEARLFATRVLAVVRAEAPNYFDHLSVAPSPDGVGEIVVFDD
jgi:thymidylate synthase (FAD)